MRTQTNVCRCGSRNITINVREEPRRAAIVTVIVVAGAYDSPVPIVQSLVPIPKYFVCFFSRRKLRTGEECKNPSPSPTDPRGTSDFVTRTVISETGRFRQDGPNDKCEKKIVGVSGAEVEFLILI